MKKILTLSILLAVPSAGYAEDAAVIQFGKETYNMQCARCHGPQGKGDGVDAKHVTVPPRDLTSGRFKFKTTVSGTPPSDEDLINGIIGHGIAGSGMPSFANLELQTKQALVAYIKTISPAFSDPDNKPEPIPLPSNKGGKIDLGKGQEIYNKLQCALCHGPNGRANGTSAFTLVDAWGKPILPTNLAQGWTYGGGSKPIDIYYRILAGIDGAPMPSYEGAATHEEIWQLSNYVASLQINPNWSMDIQAAKIKGELPKTANDAAWKQAVQTDINLQDFHYENGARSQLTVVAVSAQAVYNEEGFSLRIFWDDPIKNDKSYQPDQLLVALKPQDYKGQPRGGLNNLYDANDPALDVMFWQASEPNVVQQKKSNIYYTGRYGWNGDNRLDATSVSYDDGRWILVFNRPFNVDKKSPIDPKAERIQIAFAAWNGANNETLNKRSASQWLNLQLDNKKAGHH